jgi:hypothetical protein
LTERCENQRGGPFRSEEEVERFCSAIKYYYNQSHLAYARCVRQRQTGRDVKEEECIKEDEEYEFYGLEEPIEESEQQFVPFQMPELFDTQYVPKPTLPKQEESRSKPLALCPPAGKEEEDTSSNSDSEGEEMAWYGQRA